MSELNVANIGELTLEKGGVIEECKVAYRVFGELNKDKSNVMIFPTWYDGTTQGIIDAGLIQSGMYADSDQYYVIAIDALGNGVSSSPSHYPDNAMPEITIRDMVDSQHKLLTEVLGFDHINTALGLSMGGLQVYEWVTAYPDYMDNGIVVVATPKPSAADVYQWNFWLEMVTALCELPNGERRANRILAQAEGLAALTPAYINAVCEVGDPSSLRDETISGHTLLNCYNSIAQLQALLSHDISRNDGGNLARAAAKIKARLLTVTSLQDLTVNAALPAQFAREANMPLLEIDGQMGHFAVLGEEHMPIVLEAIQKFLAKL